MKKKKKKKKTPFDLDGALNEGGEDMEASKDDDDAVADDIDLESFGTKKKKKKKPVLVEDEEKEEDAKEDGNKFQRLLYDL